MRHNALSKNLHMTQPLLVIAGILMICSPALAQYTSNWDMNLPADSVASCDGPLCLAYNPAGLNWSASGEMLYLHFERWGKNTVAGSGDGLMLSGDRFGFSVQYLRPDRDRKELDLLKYNLVLRLFNLADVFSLGAGLEILDPTETNEDPSLDVIVGAMFRPVRYVSVGMVGRQLAQARTNGQASDLTLDLGLAVRPLWFAPERLTIAADYRLIDKLDDPPLRFSARANVYDGVSLFGMVDLEGAFGLGLGIDLLQFGASGYTSFSFDNGISNQGMVIGARASLQNHHGIRTQSKQTVEIVLGANVQWTDGISRGLFSRHTTIRDVDRAIRAAALDPRIDSLIVRMGSLDPGFTRVQELREALAQFKAKGKKIIFHMETASNSSYYLASMADAIYLSPAGSLFVAGPKLQAYFLGGAMEMVGIEAQVARVGKYKTATDALSRQEPSEAHLEVLNSLADDLADQLFDAMAEGRGLARDQVEVLVDQGFMRPSQAEEAGLVDGVIHYDELQDKIKDVIGHKPDVIRDYMSQTWHEDRWGTKPRIAVVLATGSISNGGMSLSKDMHARKVAQALKNLANDSSVDAVVLRVDSPGGSGLASELIWRQAQRLKQKKPLIVSMGAVAASGGYYISCPADMILAEPATITGSIGVFSLLFDASELWASLGISREAISRGKLADLFTSFRARTPEEMDLLQGFVNGFYKDFIGRVAKGRHMTTEQVDKIAKGRVWTGRQAKKIGLVDELGGLSKAIEEAKKRIGLDPQAQVDIIHLPRPSLGLRTLLGELGLMNRQSSLLQPLLQTAFGDLFDAIKLSSEPTLAMLPFINLSIH